MANTRRTPDAREQAAAKQLIHEYGVRGAARKTGIHHSTLTRLANGARVDEQACVALRAKTKTADDYRQITPAVRDPRRKKTTVAWPLEAIRAARDGQLAGDFQKSAPLAQAMLLDDAIFVAAHNRVAPISSLGVDLTSSGGVVGDKIRDRAQDSLTIARGTLVSIALTKAFHGIAFGYLTHATDDEGTQTDMTLTEWPIEHVKWDEHKRVFVTKVDEGEPQVITHGDGRWVVFSNFDLDPFKREACLLPSALIFAAHVDAIRDWSAASRSHGQAKIVGELPAGVPLQQGDEGTLSAEAQYFLDMLADLTSGDAGAGLRPSGSKTDFLANGSSAWQVFSELSVNREKAAARVFLGNDGVLGSVGGAPGVDIATLFGVAMTKVQGDVNAIESALYSGVYVPWTAINFGDSRKAPRLKFNMPDADKQQHREQLDASRTALLAALKSYKDNGFELTQNIVDALAAEYGVAPPRLSQAGESVSIVLAPTDVAKVVRVSEARASQGLPPFGDARDNMTLTELDEKIKADAAARQAEREAQVKQDVGSNQTGVDPGGAAAPVATP